MAYFWDSALASILSVTIPLLYKHIVYDLDRMVFRKTGDIECYYRYHDHLKHLSDRS